MSAQHKVLLLGSGFVTKPCLEILVKAGVRVIVACRTLEAAEKLSRGFDDVTPMSLDVEDPVALNAEVAKVDLIVSLVPYIHHPKIIKSAIRNKKNVVTTSYVSPAMMELDAEAKAAGITIMNEIGLDPGIDHLYAIKMIDEVHAAGGKVLSFLSYCGGLPAPEDSDNPLGYKFSWSSRGVLLALRNSAKYWKDGKVEEIPAAEVMKSAKPYLIYPGYAFIAYPNRDSTGYKERYNIPEAQTVIRGTLRYQGFAEFISVLVDLGFLEDTPVDFLEKSSQPLTWKETLARALRIESTSEEDLISAITQITTFSSETEMSRIINGLRWIGLFSNEKVIPRGNLLDTLCATLEQKMQYGPNERDMVMLQHKFEIELANGKKETRTSTLVDYGSPGGYSAMARLVGIPCGIAVKQILNRTITDRGILAPMNTKLNNPLIKELKEEYGIECIEKTI